MLDITVSDQPQKLAGEGQGALPYRYASRPPSGFTVIRKDLLRHLTEASLLKQLAIIRGPAGSGKTTLLSQWRDVGAQMDRPIAWLTVDSADRDPAHFVAGLAEALNKADCSALADDIRLIASDIADCAPIQIAQRLASACNMSQERIIVALDQYEAMDGPVAGEIVSAFLHHAAHVRMIIASRVRPAIPLGSLRARDQLFEIGPSDLNLTPIETRAVFDDSVPELYTRRLHFETSGEAVAIGFARRVVDELPRDIIGMENWQDQLHEYYRAEVLDIFPAELREAMSRLVVVERFDLSLATALIGRNAAQMIERLHNIDGLLLRHRGTQQFYFSEMLRRFLEQRLAWLENDEHVALHRRAAEWFSSHGRATEALRHAVAAKDRDMAIELLERIGYANLVTQQGVPATHQLLDAIGVAGDFDCTSALLSLALVHAHEGDSARAAIRLNEARQHLGAEQAADPVIEGQLILAEAFVAGFRDQTLQAGTAPALERFLATIPATEHEGRAQAQILLSWDHFCRGDVAAAEMLTNAAAAEYGETEGAYGCLFMHVHRVLARFWRNDLDRALEEMTLAERMTRIFFPEDQRLRAMTGVLRAGLLMEVGRPDPLIDLTALVGTVSALESWSEIQIWSHMLGARAAVAQARASEARGILSYGLEVARRMDSDRLDWTMRLASVDLALRTDDPARAAREADALGLPGGAFLDETANSLTWQEHHGGLMIGARLAMAQGDMIGAAMLIDNARARSSGASATRCMVEVELAQARLACVSGQYDAVPAHLAEARALCSGTLPVRLFVDAGEELKCYQPDLQSWAVTNVRSDRPVAVTDCGNGRDPLTARERQILLFMGEGHPNKVAAYRLGLSEATVKFHLRNIYRKLDAQNRTQALARYRTLADFR